MSSQERTSTTQRTTELELSDQAPESAASDSVLAAAAPGGSPAPEPTGPAEPTWSQVTPASGNPVSGSATDSPQAAATPDATPAVSPRAAGGAETGTGNGAAAPAASADDLDATQVIPRITDGPADHAAEAQPAPAASTQAFSAPAPYLTSEARPEQATAGAPPPEDPAEATRELPKFPPAPPRSQQPMFPPGIPLQIYTRDAQQHHTPEQAWEQTSQQAAHQGVPAPTGSRPSRRRPVATSSPSGLIVGLLGVLISAVLTYLFDLVPADDGFRLVFSGDKAGLLLGNLGKIAEFPGWQAPLAIILPLLPVAQLVLLLVLTLPRTRLVGPRLVSRARLVTLGALSVLTAYQVVVAALNAGDSGTFALLALFLAGDLIVVLALLFPHWAREDADTGPAGH